MNSILVIGAGSFGTALAQVLAKNNKVFLFTRKEDIARSINNSHRNKTYFPDVDLHENIEAVQDYSSIEKCSYIFLAIPSSCVILEFNKINNSLKNQTIVNVAKGFSQNGNTLLAEIKKQHENSISLLGPTFARDLILKSYSAFTVACDNIEHFQQVEKLFNNTHIKLDYSLNYKAIEIASIIKNVFAIAMGIFDSIDRVGVNTRFLLLTHCFKEEKKILSLFNLSENDDSLYAVFGDMLLTSLNDKSRNRTFGLLMGKGFFNKDKASSTVLLEGTKAIKNIQKLSSDNKLSTPIILFVSNVLDGECVYTAYKKCIQSL